MFALAIGFSIRGQKKCPGGDKQRYETLEQAETALMLLRARGRKDEDHAYRCATCGGYHLTSRRV